MRDSSFFIVIAVFLHFRYDLECWNRCWR